METPEPQHPSNTPEKLKANEHHHYWGHVFNFLGVILGVYLAFLINDRATIAKENKESKILMAAMFNELENDVEVYENYQIPVNQQHLKNVENLIEKISEGETELGEELSGILEVDNFKPGSTTYNSLKSSGKLSLIKNLNIQRELTNYHEIIALEAAAKGEFQVDYFTQEILAWLTNNVDFLTDELWNPGDLKRFRNKLLIYSSLIQQKIGAYEEVVNRGKDLKIQLQEEVDTI